MTDLQQMYEIMLRWREKFPNVDSVMVVLFDDEMRLRIDWNPVGDQKASYTQKFSEEQLKNMKHFPNADEFVIEKIQSAYRVWEVGEE